MKATIAVSVNKGGDVASTELCLRRVLCRLFRNALNMHEMMKLQKVVFKISLAVAASTQTPPAELATLFQRRSRQGRRKPLPYVDVVPIAALIITFGNSFYSRPRTRLKNSAPVRWAVGVRRMAKFVSGFNLHAPTSQQTTLLLIPACSLLHGFITRANVYVFLYKVG